MKKIIRFLIKIIKSLFINKKNYKFLNPKKNNLSIKKTTLTKVEIRNKWLSSKGYTVGNNLHYGL